MNTQKPPIITNGIAPARGTKKDRSFFMPNYLIYLGPNPPDPLGRFAPKSGRSPNLATCTIQKKLLEELLDLISKIRTFVKTM